MDRFRAVCLYDVLKVVCDRLERIVPRYPFKFRARTFRADPLVRVKNAAIVVNIIKVMVNLVAQVTAGQGMRRIALHLYRAA